MVGPWHVDGKIGRGGMGTIYAVVHTAIGKRAAMKVVRREILASAQAAERFLVEARAVNAIAHPGIVDIFDAGTLPDGRPYLVMEHLRGKTLGDRNDEGRVPMLEAIEYLLPLCDALSAAHATGIVHCDLKLDNIFLVDSNATVVGADSTTKVKLLDWGIASMNAVPEPSRSDMLIGTPRYVAPEQARGEPAIPASDVYSLGVVAYELFLEDPPFVAPTVAELLMLHLEAPPPSPREVWPQIPPALEFLLLAMLAKTPALRPTVGEVAAILVGLRDELHRAIAESTARRDPGRPTSVPAMISQSSSSSRIAGSAPRRVARTPTPTQLGRDPTELGPDPTELGPDSAQLDMASAPIAWTRLRRWLVAAAASMMITGAAVRLFTHRDNAPTAAASGPAASAERTAVPAPDAPVARPAGAPRPERTDPAVGHGAPRAPSPITTASANQPAAVASDPPPSGHAGHRAGEASTGLVTRSSSRPRGGRPTTARSTSAPGSSRAARAAYAGPLHPDAVIDPYD